MVLKVKHSVGVRRNVVIKNELLALQFWRCYLLDRSINVLLMVIRFCHGPIWPRHLSAICLHDFWKVRPLVMFVNDKQAAGDVFDDAFVLLNGNAVVLCPVLDPVDESLQIISF